MKVRELIKKLKDFNQEADILLGCDEELNTIYSDVQVDYYVDGDEQDNSENKVVMWGNSGSELE